MEEKGTRLNNIMNRKVNMDFLKNINLPPIKIPNIRSRKIFNAKTSTKPETLAPPPEPTCIDRSPSRISTISSLMHINEPEPDDNPRFGRLSLTQSAHDVRPNRDDNVSDVKGSSTYKPLTFSEKLSKQYKGISDFKFRHILGKQTVVRTTTIDPNDYSYHPEECGSERSDYEFEFHSLPASKAERGVNFVDDDDIEFIKGVPKKGFSRQTSSESADSKRSRKHIVKGSTAAQRDGSMHFDGSLEPNKSSLFKQMRSFSLKRKSSSFDKHVEKKPSEKSSEDDVKPLKKQGLPKMSFNRQALEDACSKAKTSVTNKIQKLKNLHIRRQNSESSAPTHDKYTKKPSPDIIFPNITYGAENDGVVRSLSPPTAISRPSSRGWCDQPIRQSSIDSMRVFPRRALRIQSSVDSSDEMTMRSEPVRSASRYFESESEDEIEVTPKTHIEDSYGYPKRGPIVGKALLESNIRISAENSEQQVSRNIESNWKVARPSPPPPPVRLCSLNSSSTDTAGKTDMIRQRFSQKQDTSNSSVYVHTSNDSQDSDSWIPDVFKGPSNNQLTLSSIDEGENAWSMEHSPPESVKKSVSIDIFNANGEAPFDDFEEALKNVPTVDIPGSVVARLSMKLKENMAVKQIVEEKMEEHVITANSNTRNKRFNFLISRFESNSVEIGSTESIDSILVGASDIVDRDNIDTNANYPLVYATKSSILQPIVNEITCSEPKPTLIQEKIHSSTSQVQKTGKNLDERFGIEAGVLSVQNGIIHSSPQEEINMSFGTESKLSQPMNEDRPYLKKMLPNEVTILTTSYDDTEEDIFHSLDYEDAEQMDAKPLSHRRSIKVLYTAEV